MVNKLIAILSFCLIFGTLAYPQNLSIRVEGGYGTFRMADLKDFQEFILPDMGVKVESLSKFPPYCGFGVEAVSYYKSGIGIGVMSDFYSTGATNYYEDYSGYYKLNMQTHAYNIGTVFSIRHLKLNHINSFFEIAQGIKFSSMSLNEEMYIRSPVFKESYAFESASWWIRPVYRCEYKIFNFLSAGIFLGAEFNLKSKLHLKDNKDAKLRVGQHDATFDWTGIRGGMHLSFDIP